MPIKKQASRGAGLQFPRRVTREDVDVFDLFEGVWRALEEYSFVEITPEKIRLVGDGPFYTPLIQTLLAEKRYSQLRERMVAEVQGMED